MGEYVSARMPHNSSAGCDGNGEVIEAKVLERPALSNGDPIWQAEITVPQGAINHSGQARYFNIRGPPRKSQTQAEEDAEQFTSTSINGPRALRTLANQLHR